MSRYTGPRVKVLRALGVDLPGLTRKTRERRPYPPGQHGQARRKASEYALRLIEKQKLRMNYGLTEAQLRRVVVEAQSGRTNTAESIVRVLESRLDNLVFRAGFARTIAAARQLVGHGHVLVDGRKVDVASYRVGPGRVVSIRERSRRVLAIEAALANPLPGPTPWLEVDVERKCAKLLWAPEHDAVPFPVNIQLVIEYYSNRL